MPITAYSNYFSEELDVAQLLSKLGYDTAHDPDYTQVPSEIRQFISDTVVCPSCGIGRPSIVGRSKSRKTGVGVGQPHFRFSLGGYNSAHDPMCDFFDETRTSQPAHLVDFRLDQSAQTQYVRELVCRGIEQQAFSQATIRAMRQWFLEVKREHSFAMDVTPDLLTWCGSLYRTQQHLHAYPFHPSHGDLPNYDWKVAATRVFAERHEALLTECRRTYFRVWFHDRELPSLIKFAKRYQGKAVFNVLALENHYRDTISLSRFIIDQIHPQRHSTVYLLPSLGNGKSLSSVLAFGALLLFASAWDTNKAIDLFVKLATSPPAANPNAGNIVGLNPFHDYESWAHMIIARYIGTKRFDATPVETQIQHIALELQRQHAHWKATQPF